MTPNAFKAGDLVRLTYHAVVVNHGSHGNHVFTLPAGSIIQILKVWEYSPGTGPFKGMWLIEAFDLSTKQAIESSLRDDEWELWSEC